MGSTRSLRWNAGIGDTVGKLTARALLNFERSMPSWSEKATESAIDYARERLGIEGLKKQSESLRWVSLPGQLWHYLVDSTLAGRCSIQYSSLVGSSKSCTASIASHGYSCIYCLLHCSRCTRDASLWFHTINFLMNI